MSGVKGRSGGARPGAGAKPKPKVEWPAPKSGESPLAFLIGVMNDESQEPALRVRAAIAAAQYEHPKRSEGGKKEAQQVAAEAAASKFATPMAPKLVVSNA